MLSVMFQGEIVLTLEVDRDSVHAGDDMSSHVVAITVKDSMSIYQLLIEASEVCTLPKISGGKATWFAYTDSEPKQYLGVVAQQWQAPKLLVHTSETVGSIFGKGSSKLIFRYWCQSDPDKIYEALASNNELPSRFL